MSETQTTKDDAENNDTDASTDINIDCTLVTQAATTDIRDILSRPRDIHTRISERTMPMPGFDDTFVDIVDYILRITHWIWHDKEVELCSRYYSQGCVLHTMVGDIVGCDTVVENTVKTLEAFSDRILDGENVVWSRDGSGDNMTYYSSHLITSRMTNDGDSEWGPATNIRATRIRTIADCVCRDNKIVEEWLMRDNAFLVETLGFSVEVVAKSQAKADFERGWSLVEFLEPERNRVKKNRKDVYPLCDPIRVCGTDGAADANTTSFAQVLLGYLWQTPYDSSSSRLGVSVFYDTRVTAHLPHGRDVYGTLELTEFLSMYKMGLSEIAISVDHVACIPYLWEPGSSPRENGAVDLAVRWTMTAKHTGDSDLLGPASGAPVYLLAGSHWRIVRGTRIREEWTVWDEIALLRQVESYRLTHP